MRIKSSHKETQGDFIIIEDADFDPVTMQIYADGEISEPRTRRKRE